MKLNEYHPIGTGAILDERMVKWLFDQPASMYRDENHGISAIVDASADMLMGKIVRFAVCTREPEGTGAPPVVREVLAFGMDDNPDAGKQTRISPRFCGEGEKPSGSGSHSLIPTWYGYCGDRESIIAALALVLGKSPWWFRLPNGKEAMPTT